MIASVAIAPGTDQIGFDPKRAAHLLRLARLRLGRPGDGGGGVRSLGDVPSPKGAHTLAVDPATGDVWVSYSDAAASYLQRFTAAK